MSAPELHRSHPHQTEVTVENLYRLMYNRVISGSLFWIEGTFWPTREPLPEGFDITMARGPERPGPRLRLR
jgi:hypothetical protein